jgi:carbon storage regulator
MLVLSRKTNEQIVIEGGITITIVQIRGDKVRLGIIAPKDVSVNRSEIQDKINENKEQAE